jgi:hypothetical protein
MTEQQMVLGTAIEEAEALELVDVEVLRDVDPAELASAAAGVDPLAERNLFGEADRIAARVASAGTRRQYAAIYRAFGDWLSTQLGRPPLVGDLDADVIGAYARHLASAGGRGGRPAAPATARL